MDTEKLINLIIVVITALSVIVNILNEALSYTQKIQANSVGQLIKLNPIPKPQPDPKVDEQKQLVIN